MKIIFWNIGEYKNCIQMNRKHSILVLFVKNELPDIFCVIEGTKSKIHNFLIKKLFRKLGYKCFYSPSMPKLKKYKNYFDGYNSYNPFGLKIFIKNDTNNIHKEIEVSDVLYKGRLIKVVINQKMFIFIHRNRSANKHENDAFFSQITRWLNYEVDISPDNIYILGDFNYPPYGIDYFEENSGYIPTTIIKQVHEIRVKEKLGLSLYTPIIDLINDKNEINFGGTYYKNDKRYKWQVLDYVLFQKYEVGSNILNIITEIYPNIKLINNSSSITKNYINHNFDHLPIKLELL